MAMRVYIKYEPPADAPPELCGKMNIKIKLPASWASQPVEKICQLFCEQYKAKHGNDFPLDHVTIVLSDGRQVAQSHTINTIIAEHDELTVLYAVPPAVTQTMSYAALPPTSGSKESASGGAGEEGMKMCKNYGCLKKYREEDNNDTSCRHHVAPPLFREGAKQWSCCPDQSSWDWDGFMQIPGCKLGKHSDEAPGATFAMSPTVAAAAAANTKADAAGAAPPPAVRSIADYNAQNPDAPTALTSLSKSMDPNTPKKLVVRADGAKQCVHFGCQKFFQESENSPTACQYHRTGPVFHEGMKYWGCCPGTKHIDFEEFMAHPGCERGPHEAGTV